MSDAGSPLIDPPSNPDDLALSSADLSLLGVFRKFLVGPGEMLCFFGPDLDKHRTALARLTELDLLVKERFRGGYALTALGFDAMNAQKSRSKSGGAEADADRSRKVGPQRRRARAEKPRPAGRRS